MTEGEPRCSMKEFLEIYFFTTPAAVLCQKKAARECGGGGGRGVKKRSRALKQRLG